MQEERLSTLVGFEILRSEKSKTRKRSFIKTSLSSVISSTLNFYLARYFTGLSLKYSRFVPLKIE